MRNDREHWDARYREPKWRGRHEPYPLLVRHADLLTGGRAIDLACGMGHNSLWLADRGYTVLGVDISGVAIERARAEARLRSCTNRVTFTQADLSEWAALPGTYDLVCVIRYLNRDLFPAIRAALEPGGLLFYASLNLRRLDTRPDTDPRYILEDGELLRAFAGLEVLKAGDEGDISYLIARQYHLQI